MHGHIIIWKLYACKYVCSQQKQKYLSTSNSHEWMDVWMDVFMCKTRHKIYSIALHSLIVTNKNIIIIGIVMGSSIYSIIFWKIYVGK